MKKCPFCAEQIQDEAIKCKHCGEFIDASIQARLAKGKIKWYFRTSFLVFVFLTAPPLALPLVWLRPATSREWKIGFTAAVLILTWATYVVARDSVHILNQYAQMIQGF